MKKKEQVLYTRVAEAVAQLSHCRRSKVGAVIVHGHTVVYGYNGTPTGEPNECEDTINEVLVTKPTVIHAEANAIYKMREAGVVPDVRTAMFCTLAPCAACATKIIAAGVQVVYFAANYRDMSGVEMLRSAGVRTLLI